MYQKWIKVLSTCALFNGINSDNLQGVLHCLKPKVNSYEKNEWVTAAGEKIAGLGIVLSGEVVVAQENAAGNRVIITVDGPGEMFGEMTAFLESVESPATVMARAACTVMFLPAGKVVSCCENSCASHKLMITNMLKIVSEKALVLHRKVEYLAIKSLRAKISTFLLEQHKRTGNTTFMMPLKRNELADFLNVTRPSLSREMGKLMEEGIIEFHMSSVKIKDLHSLRTMAE